MTESRLLILNGAGLNSSNLQSGNVVELQAIQNVCDKSCAENKLQMDFRQSEDPQQLLSWLGDLARDIDALIVNPGIGFNNPDRFAVAVSGVAQRNKPVIEVHLDNIFSQNPQQNEPLNIVDGKTGFISGLSIHGYTLAINSIAEKLRAGA